MILLSNSAENVATSMDPWQIVQSFEFWLIAFVNFAIITSFKQGLRSARKVHYLRVWWVDILMSFFPLLLGSALGIVLFPGYVLHLRWMIGLSAGFLNPFAFKALSRVPFLKDLLAPTEALVPPPPVEAEVAPPTEQE